MNGIHIDLNILDGDLDLDNIFSPSKLTVADVISQDIKHRLLESGLLIRLIKLRNVNGIAMVLTELELVVEQDNRLIPGSINIFKNQSGSISITASTKQYGKLEA